MKDTALTEVHRALGAKMAPFAGYNMPIQYEGINAEHEAVRETVGIFDISHMGEFLIKGEHSLELIQRVTTNDASKLKIGQVQYTCMTNEHGGIIDDLLVYMLDHGSYMLVVNASNIEKDWGWLNLNNLYQADITDRSAAISLISVQGPYAIDTLQKLTKTDLSEIPYYHFNSIELNGVPNVIVSNTGYTGASGFEVYVENSEAKALWDAIFSAGRGFRIRPIGLGARDTLRLEMGFCLYGNDIDDTTTPLEAGLGWITKLNKDFTAKDILQVQRDYGPKKKLIGIEMLDRGIPRHGYRIFNAEHEIIGHITSGTQSPTLKTGIGMGYVNIDYAQLGTIVYIEIRNQFHGARIANLPFVKR
ncbi:MAG: glycine cleavage system aminomethyltransferase GcvT [Pedobacter sp.]|jgi:aminomethyltransferase|uniref:glycine cleavage system aminomethyltransferase GcvT n=1 Tax=Pedobacter sp. TaxID=1411316 RepID=UPI003562F4AA